MRPVPIAVALLLSAAPSLAEEIVTLPTRSGVTQSYLLSAPAAGKARAVAILFAGGAGKVDLERERAREPADPGNFLVRSRLHFVAADIATAVMGAPTDQPAGMDDAFRTGNAHIEDIRKVAADVRARFPGAPVFLVGTSRGTISAAVAGSRLPKTVEGVVLTATLFRAAGRRPGLSRFDFSSITAPVLFVHHVSDGCAYTPYAAAKDLAGRFPLVSVAGGAPPEADPCEAMTPHGFLGKEAETVNAIARWMLKQPYPLEIN